MNQKKFVLLAIWLMSCFGGLSSAQDNLVAEEVQENSNYAWMAVAAFLVFAMQIGLTMVEAGFARAKNFLNIVLKNIVGASVAVIVFWAFGFGIMFGSAPAGLFGTSGFFFSDFSADKNPWVFSFWIFQAMLAAIVVNIVSGTMTERTKFIGYILGSAGLSLIVYPVFGSWVWGSLHRGSGWLESLGFIDFAGSGVICAMSGWVALAGAIVIGPRMGKYGKEGLPRPMPGHNLPLAALGAMVMWLGWYGLNAGSALSASSNISIIIVVTTLAAASGSLGAMLTAWVKHGKPDASAILAGVLSGLAAIAAGCNNLTPFFAVIVGAISGFLAVNAIPFFEKIGVDDPTGAISIYGVGGTWGVLSAGLFNAADTFNPKIIIVQFIGAIVVFIWAFGASFAMFKLIEKTAGLRLLPEDESYGSDYAVHGSSAFPGQ